MYIETLPGKECAKLRTAAVYVAEMFALRDGVGAQAGSLGTRLCGLTASYHGHRVHGLFVIHVLIWSRSQPCDPGGTRFASPRTTDDHGFHPLSMLLGALDTHQFIQALQWPRW